MVNMAKNRLVWVDWNTEQTNADNSLLDYAMIRFFSCDTWCLQTVTNAQALEAFDNAPGLVCLVILL